MQNGLDLSCSKACDGVCQRGCRAFWQNVIYAPGMYCRSCLYGTITCWDGIRWGLEKSWPIYLHDCSSHARFLWVTYAIDCLWSRRFVWVSVLVLQARVLAILPGFTAFWAPVQRPTRKFGRPRGDRSKLEVGLAGWGCLFVWSFSRTFHKNTWYVNYVDNLLVTRLFVNICIVVDDAYSWACDIKSWLLCDVWLITCHRTLQKWAWPFLLLQSICGDGIKERKLYEFGRGYDLISSNLYQGAGNL